MWKLIMRRIQKKRVEITEMNGTVSGRKHQLGRRTNRKVILQKSVTR